MLNDHQKLKVLIQEIDAALGKSRQETVRMKARCLIDYFRISLSMRQEPQVQKYMSELENGESKQLFQFGQFLFFLIQIMLLRDQLGLVF